MDELKSKVVEIGSSNTQLLSCVASGKTVITSLQIGNVDGASDATVSLSLSKNGASAITFISDVTISVGKTLPLFSSENGKLFLEDNGTPDSLSAVASTAGDLVALISYIERT